ncbi:MAG: ATP-binding protein [Firmicutes bacterium]|nr:ATP-binding protein [Bacillota bacterium]
MTGKISRSILLVAVCVLLCCSALFLGVLYAYFSEAQTAQLENSLNLAARGVSQSGIFYLQGLESNCRLTWVDADGTVLFDSEADTQTMENHAQREEIQQAFANGTGESVRYSETMTQRTVYRATLLPDGTVLRISASYATVFSLVMGMLQPIATILLLAMVLSAVLALKLTDKVMQPMAQLDMEHLPEKSPYPELTPLLEKIRGQQREIAWQKQELADKRLNMEFAEQNRQEFTANVSHELKTPLQSIMGSAELIENGLVKPSDLPRFAGNIRKEANRLLLLIEDIIHLSRLDEGCPLQPEPVELYALAEEEVRALKPIARANNVRLTLEGDAVVIDGIPQLVQEILHNLCDNAVKYNRPGGQVTVGVTGAGEDAVLSVADTGIGISPEDQSRIFERFYRADKSRSKATGGTGLGLSIVKHAAGYLNGEISLESAVGVGTTITVTFRGKRHTEEKTQEGD